VADLVLQGLRKTFDGGVTAVHDVSLRVNDGEFMVMVGPSGCGKSTTLRMIAGLESITDGQLRIGGRDVTHVPPAERGVAMVFQSYALYPHMTVAENMGFSLKIAGQGKAAVAARVQAAAQTLQIEALLDRKPRELSGGQRQRVAIGRAIVREPGVFLFDEPLSNLDAALRTQMRLELSRLHERLKATIVYVTHDQVEAMTLGQRIAIFNAGRIEQIGSPMQLYDRPANQFVAGFLGSPRMNFLPARVSVSAEGVSLAIEAGGEFALPRSWQPGLTEVCSVGFRPEHLGLSLDADGPGVPAEVQLVELLGDTTIVHAACLLGGTMVAVKAQPDAVRGLAPGQRVRLQPDPARVMLFSASGTAVWD
jgi:multiple sugar transport system ATP-binding protein